jgi:hypothetical protein
MMPRGRRSSIERNNSGAKKEKEEHCQEECELHRTTLVPTMLRGETGTPLSNNNFEKRRSTSKSNTLTNQLI